MAHNLEIKNGKASMMYVGETPWHGLGEYLGENAVTAEEAIKAAKMDWKVDVRPVFVDGVRQDKYQAVIREDTGDVLSIMKGRYVPFQNEDAFKVLDPVIGSGQAVWHTAGVLGNGETIWVLAKLPGTIEVTKKDIVDKYFLLTNSHDGSKAIQLRFTPVRVVCQNTLQMALLQEGDLISIRHTTNYKNRINQALEFLGLVRKYEQEFQETAKAMYEFKMTDEQIDQYIADILNIATDAKNRVNMYEENRKALRIRELVESGIGTDIPGVKGSLWGVYNAVAESVDHTERKIKDWAAYSWFGTGNNLKSRAWECAKKMLQ